MEYSTDLPGTATIGISDRNSPAQRSARIAAQSAEFKSLAGAPTNYLGYGTGIVGFDSAGKRIVVFDRNGTVLTTFTDPAWVKPVGMCCGLQNRSIWVADSNRVLAYDHAGNFQGVLVDNLPSVGPICSDRSGSNLYVANPAGNNILRYDEHGKFMLTIDNWTPKTLRNISNISSSPTDIGLVVSFAGDYNPNSNTGGVVEVSIDNGAGGQFRFDGINNQQNVVLAAAHLDDPNGLGGLFSIYYAAILDNFVVSGFAGGQNDVVSSTTSFYAGRTIYSMKVVNTGAGGQDSIFLGVDGGIGVWQDIGGFIGPLNWDYQSVWTALDLIEVPTHPE